MNIEDDTQQQAPGELDAAQVDDQEASTSSQENGEIEAGQEELQDDPAAQPKPKGVQKRIDELTSNWRNTERDRDYWRDLAMQNMQGAKPNQDREAAPAAPDTPTSEKPKADGYDSYEQYLEALTDWKVEQRVAAQQQERQKTEQRTQQEQQQQVFQQRAQSFRAETPDFDAVAFNPALPVTEAMADVIRDSDDGPKLLYHLGKNPQDAARIASLSPYAAAREIGKIEALLSIPAPKKTTNAPPPINTLNGGGETVTTDPDKMSADQWLQWRNKQLQGK